jgi:hypothetical protein
MLSLGRAYTNRCVERGGSWTSGIHLLWWTRRRLVEAEVFDPTPWDRFKKKALPDYQHLMQRCFAEYQRVLKPGRWMTVVFSNSRAGVWTAIQVALQQAGFVVAEVSALDKQQGSYRQVTSTTASTTAWSPGSCATTIRFRYPVTSFSPACSSATSLRIDGTMARCGTFVWYPCAL